MIRVIPLLAKARHGAGEVLAGEVTELSDERGIGIFVDVTSLTDANTLVVTRQYNEGQGWGPRLQTVCPFPCLDDDGLPVDEWYRVFEFPTENLNRRVRVSVQVLGLDAPFDCHARRNTSQEAVMADRIVRRALRG